MSPCLSPRYHVSHYRNKYFLLLQVLYWYFLNLVNPVFGSSGANLALNQPSEDISKYGACTPQMANDGSRNRRISMLTKCILTIIVGRTVTKSYIM